MSNNTEKILLTPRKLVVQLNRTALKFLDTKGSIANKFFSPENDVTWLLNPTIQIPSLGETLKITSKKRKRNIYVSFDKFTYEQNELKIDELQYLPNEVARFVKDIDREILNTDHYNRYGIRLWYSLVNVDLEEFIIDNILKTSNQKSEMDKIFKPTSVYLEFAGRNNSQNLNYNLHVSSNNPYQEEDDFKLNEKEVFIDVDFFRVNVRGISDLLPTIQGAISSSQVVIQEFMEKVAQWQK